MSSEKTVEEMRETMQMLIATCFRLKREEIHYIALEANVSDKDAATVLYAYFDMVKTKLGIKKRERKGYKFKKMEE